MSHYRRAIKSLPLGGYEERHQEAEGESDEESDGAVRHGSLLPARTCGGILCAMCWRRKSIFADETVQIRIDGLRIQRYLMYPQIYSTDLDVVCCNILDKTDLEHLKSPASPAAPL